ncbi:hypothetical protein DFJ74DRAFT_774092 [Hyaloraphidium curvatum]|nr:hypothetical protein DFJ74DRAFT_774092 [Hyaloraphidium curvatum]
MSRLLVPKLLGEGLPPEAAPSNLLELALACRYLSSVMFPVLVRLLVAAGDLGDVFKEDFKSFQYNVVAPLNWGLLRVSRINHLEISASHPVVLKELTAATRLRPTLRTLEVDNSFENCRELGLDTLFALIERTDHLQSWCFQPFQELDWDLSPFPGVVFKMSEVWTFSYNQDLLLHLFELSTFNPHADDTTRYFAWGLPPNLEKMSITRPQPGLEEEDFGRVRQAVVDGAIKVTFSGVTQGPRCGWYRDWTGEERMVESEEWEDLWGTPPIGTVSWTA